MRRVSRYYSRVDEEATANRAHEELCRYDENYHLAQRAASLQSPQYDGMPKSPSTDNHVEGAIVNHVYATTWVAKVKWTLSVLANERYAHILQLAYINHLDDTAIMERIGLEKSRYYEVKRDALIAFAETWLPFPSELVVKK